MVLFFTADNKNNWNEQTSPVIKFMVNWFYHDKIAYSVGFVWVCLKLSAENEICFGCAVCLLSHTRELIYFSSSIIANLLSIVKKWLAC